MNSSRVIRRLRPFLDEHPRLRKAAQKVDRKAGVWRHSIADRFPSVIRPKPRQLTVAITAKCNLKCVGCRYGRDFMVGEQLPIEMVRDLLDDAKAAGVSTVRYYGGEPLLHANIVEAVEYATRIGLNAYVTTNGTLLEKKIDDLYAAGMRWLTMGFYGVGHKYTDYTQREGHYEKLEQGLTTIRERYGDKVQMQLNWVVLGPTCNLEALDEAWSFARRFDLFFHLDLQGYSIPFFTNGPEGQLEFKEEDRERVATVGKALLDLKREFPDRLPHTEEFLRSVPDWLMLGPNMRIPCDAYELLWVGADGTVQLCDVCFPLGNLHDKRLRELVFTPEHQQASRDAFQLKCPNCTCKVETRIQKHAASQARYRG